MDKTLVTLQHLHALPLPVPDTDGVVKARTEKTAGAACQPPHFPPMALKHCYLALLGTDVNLSIAGTTGNQFISQHTYVQHARIVASG